MVDVTLNKNLSNELHCGIVLLGLLLLPLNSGCDPGPPEPGLPTGLSRLESPQLPDPNPPEALTTEAPTTEELTGEQAASGHHPVDWSPLDIATFTSEGRVVWASFSIATPQVPGVERALGAPDFLTGLTSSDALATWSPYVDLGGIAQIEVQLAPTLAAAVIVAEVPPTGAVARVEISRFPGNWTVLFDGISEVGASSRLVRYSLPEPQEIAWVRLTLRRVPEGRGRIDAVGLLVSGDQVEPPRDLFGWPVPPDAVTELSVQWASSVVAYSTASTVQAHPEDVLGAPTLYPGLGFSGGGIWGPAPGAAGPHWLEVGFDPPVDASAIVIGEAGAPGLITGVVDTTLADAPEPLWSGQSPTPSAQRGQLLRLNLPAARTISSLRLEAAESDVSYAQVRIDAIGLVPADGRVEVERGPRVWDLSADDLEAAITRENLTFATETFAFIAGVSSPAEGSQGRPDGTGFAVTPSVPAISVRFGTRHWSDGIAVWAVGTVTFAGLYDASVAPSEPVWLGSMTLSEASGTVLRLDLPAPRDIEMVGLYLAAEPNGLIGPVDAVALLGANVTAEATHNLPEDAVWAVTVVEATSAEPHSPAEAATGTPDAFPEAAFETGHTFEGTDTEAGITVAFPQSVTARGIVVVGIGQTQHLRQVLDTTSESPVSLWRGEVLGFEGANAIVLTFPEPREMSALRLQVDGRFAIDAVGLLPALLPALLPETRP